jgi:hypothetical protein
MLSTRTTRSMHSHVSFPTPRSLSKQTGRQRRRKRRSHARAPRGGHGDRERRHAEMGGPSSLLVTPWGSRVKAVPHPILHVALRSPPGSVQCSMQGHGCCGSGFAFARDRLMAGSHPVDSKRGHSARARSLVPRRSHRHAFPCHQRPDKPALAPDWHSDVSGGAGFGFSSLSGTRFMKANTRACAKVPARAASRHPMWM